MTSDDSTCPRDTKWREPGLGLHTRWECLGCRQRREMRGSRGVGINRRCAVCVAKRQAA